MRANDFLMKLLAFGAAAAGLVITSSCGDTSTPAGQPHGQYTTLGPGFTSKPSLKSPAPVPTPVHGRLLIDGFAHYGQTVTVPTGTMVTVAPRRNPSGSTFKTPVSSDTAILSPTAASQLSDGTPEAAFVASSPGAATVTATVIAPSCGSEAACQGDFVVHVTVRQG